MPGLAGLPWLLLPKASRPSSRAVPQAPLCANHPGPDLRVTHTRPCPLPTSLLPPLQKLTDIKGLSDAKVEKLLDAARKLCPQFGLVTAKAYDAQVRSEVAEGSNSLLLSVTSSVACTCCCSSYQPPLTAASAAGAEVLRLLLLPACLQRHREIVRISTGCQAVDELLGGGIETKAVSSKQQPPPPPQQPEACTCSDYRGCISVLQSQLVRPPAHADHRGLWRVAHRQDAALPHPLRHCADWRRRRRCARLFCT